MRKAIGIQFLIWGILMGLSWVFKQCPEESTAFFVIFSGIFIGLGSCLLDDHL